MPCFCAPSILNLTLSHIRSYSDYVRPYQKPAIWRGRATSIANLTGEVTPNDFQLIMSSGWDLKFTAPQTVSNEIEKWNVLSVLEAHDDAVNSVMDWIENGQLYIFPDDIPTHVNQLLYVTYRHRCDNKGYPQTHTHVLFPDLVITEPNTPPIFTLDLTNLEKVVKEAQIKYLRYLANNLDETGYRVRYKAGQLEIDTRAA
jgi:TrwC relaxase